MQVSLREVLEKIISRSLEIRTEARIAIGDYFYLVCGHLISEEGDEEFFKEKARKMGIASEDRIVGISELNLSPPNWFGDLSFLNRGVLVINREGKAEPSVIFDSTSFWKPKEIRRDLVTMRELRLVNEPISYVVLRRTDYWKEGEEMGDCESVFEDAGVIEVFLGLQIPLDSFDCRNLWFGLPGPSSINRAISELESFLSDTQLKGVQEIKSWVEIRQTVEVI